MAGQRASNAAAIPEPVDAAQTAIPDVRETAAEQIVDEPGRIPAATESEAAVRRAQTALAEIEQRRILDDQRADEEVRAAQLNQWAADDQTQEADLTESVRS